MRDPYLSAIIESVEAKGEPVSITVALHSGAVVSGFVRRSQFFVSVAKNETQRALQEERPRSRTREVTERQEERIRTIYSDLEGLPECEAMTLSDVTMVWSNGDGLKLKAIRLSLDASAAWWVANGEPIKAPKDAGGFWAVGVTF